MSESYNSINYVSNSKFVQSATTTVVHLIVTLVMDR